MSIHVNIADLIGAEPIKGAWISEDNLYRYALWRIWEPAARKLVVCMLNPSTADGRKDDPTIRRLIAFAKLWGYGGILVVNLYAYRTAHPTELRGRPYDVLVGPENNAILEAAITEGELVLVGWGAANWRALAGGTMRRDDVLGFIAHAEAKAMCLGLTAAGEPKHPLYVLGDQPMVPFK